MGLSLQQRLMVIDDMLNKSPNLTLMEVIQLLHYSRIDKLDSEINMNGTV